MLDLAQNLQATAKELVNLINKEEEVDILLAEHPNVTADILWKLYESTQDKKLLQSIAKNPKTDLRLLNFLAVDKGLGADVLNNPVLGQLLEEYPNLLDEIPNMVALPNCPLEILIKAADLGSRFEQFRVLLNDKTPLEIKSKLTPVYLNNQSKINFKNFRVKHPDFEQFISHYENLGLNYCLPEFLPLDHTNRTHRLSDQVIKGFPFTSDSFPWPSDSNEAYKQPLAQIDLDNASKLLGVNLGDSLLQLWMDADPLSTDNWEIDIRIIPASVYKVEELDNFYPKESDWHPHEDEDSDCPIYLKHSEMPYPRVSWISMGFMFPNPEKVLDGFRDGMQLSKQAFSELSRETEVITRQERGLGVLRLGGYPDGAGNDSDYMDWQQLPSSENLLLFISCPYDVFFGLSLTYEIDVNGVVKFKAYVSSDG